MSWLGIGLTAGSRAPLAAMAGNVPPPTLTPSAVWTGVEGSGFTAIPIDPARTTAKPALHLLTPPGQHFTNTLDVGALAMANDGGSLFDTLGIASVTFHFEGSRVTVTEPRWHTIQTERGAKTYFGWWARLQKPAGRAGFGNLYITATPRDETMQARVIGPYLFAPQDTEHDGTLSVQPSQPEIAGSRYQSINAAQAYAKAQGWQNYRISLDEAGRYDMTANVNPNFNNQKGWCEIIAGVAGVSLGKDTYTTDASAQMHANRSRIRLRGAALTFDLKNVVEFVAENMWLDGINVTTRDPAGYNEILRGRSPDQKGWRFAGGGNLYMTECEVSQNAGAYGQAKLVRGGTGSNMTYDIFGDCECVVFNTINTHRGGIWTADNPGIVVYYTGAEATATLARTGVTINNPATATFTATWGANSATFATGLLEEFYTGASGDGYTLQDLANWINSLPGFTAVLEAGANPDLACSVVAPYQTLGNNFDSNDAFETGESINVKTAPVPLSVTFNRHSDYYQQANGIKENRLFAFNRGFDMETQTLFASPILVSGVAGVWDTFFVGNALHNSTTPGDYYTPGQVLSQFGRGTGCSLSHLVFAHNSMNQRVSIRNDSANNTADAYCMFANSVIPSFIWGGGNELENITLKNLHLFTGEVPPSNSTNVVVGGDESTLFANAAAGDFTPAGALLNEGFVPTLPTDFSSNPFITGDGIGDAAGAVRAPSGEGLALYQPPPPSDNPVDELLARFDAVPGGKSDLWELANASDTNPGNFGGIWSCIGQSANANLLRQNESNPNRRPTITSAGAVFDSAARGHVEQVIAGGTFSVFMSITLAPTSTSGTLMSDQASNSAATYTSGGGTSLPNLVQVDGVTVSTVGALHDALKVGGTEKTLAILGANFSGDTELIIGRSTASLVGTVRRVAVVSDADFPTTLADVRNLAAQAVR